MKNVIFFHLEASYGHYDIILNQVPESEPIPDPEQVLYPESDQEPEPDQEPDQAPEPDPGLLFPLSDLRPSEQCCGAASFLCGSGSG
jgi:hypothetical protein